MRRALLAHAGVAAVIAAATSAPATIGDGADPPADFAYEGTSLPRSSTFGVEDHPNATWVFPCVGASCGGDDDLATIEQLQVRPDTVRLFGFPVGGGPGTVANGSSGTKEMLVVGLNDANPAGGDFTNSVLGWRHDGGLNDVDSDPFTFDIAARVDYGAATMGNLFKPLGIQIASGTPSGVGDRALEINFMIGAGNFDDATPGFPTPDPARFDRIVLWDGYGGLSNYGAHVIDVPGLDVRQRHVYRITTDNLPRHADDGAIHGVDSRQVKIYLDDIADPVFDGFLQTFTHESSRLEVSTRADCTQCYINADVEFIRAVDGTSLTRPPIESPPPKQVMIVSSGLNAPDTVYLRNNISDLSRRPFDGVATWVAVDQVARLESGRLRLQDNEFQGANLGRTVVWRRYNEPWMYRGAVSDLQQIQASGGMDDHFLAVRLGNPPRGVVMDWFDDGWWDQIAHNIGIMARIADRGGVEGLLIDLEGYTSVLWGYEQLQEADPQTYGGKEFTQVKDKVRQRGREFGQAISEENHDPTLMFFSAAGFVAYQINHLEWTSLEDAPSGLIVPFLDGVLEGTSAQTTIIDANSWNKWMTQDAEFALGRDLVAEEARALSEVPDLYADKVKVGYTFRLSYNPGDGEPGDQFDPADPNANFFTPARLESSVRKAIEYGDGPVLFWEGLGNWWLDSATALPADGAPVGDWSRWIDPVYWQAVANARAFFSAPPTAAPEPGTGVVLLLAGTLIRRLRGAAGLR